MNDFAKLCLATGLCLLCVAVAERLLGRYCGEWLQVSSVALVGLFHLILAACNWPAGGWQTADSVAAETEPTAEFERGESNPEFPRR